MIFAILSTVLLWPEGRMPDPQPNQKEDPCYVWHEPARRTSDAVLIVVSGGGYFGSRLDNFEVTPVKDYFLGRGLSVVTMRYRAPRPLGLPKHLSAWQDVQRTVRLVRREADRRGLNSEKIGFMGFSAGGHLAVLAATSSRIAAYAPIDEVDRIPCHVNWAVAVYPAYLLADGVDGHNGGNDPRVELVNDFAFDERTPPMCFVHGDSDLYSAVGSIQVVRELRRRSVPAELHVYACEPHAFMLNSHPGVPAAGWKDRVWEWFSDLPGDVWFVEDPDSRGIDEIYVRGDKTHRNNIRRADGQEEPDIGKEAKWGLGSLAVDGERVVWRKPLRMTKCGCVYCPHPEVEIAVTRKKSPEGFEERYEVKNVSQKDVCISGLRINAPLRPNVGIHVEVTGMVDEFKLKSGSSSILVRRISLKKEY